MLPPPDAAAVLATVARGTAAIACPALTCLLGDGRSWCRYRRSRSPGRPPMPLMAVMTVFLMMVLVLLPTAAAKMRPWRTQPYDSFAEGSPAAGLNSVAVCGGSVYVYNGMDAILSQLHLPTREWTTISTGSPSPGFRVKHHLVAQGSQLFLYGGESKEGTCCESRSLLSP